MPCHMNTSCLPAGRLSVYAILPSEVSAESGKFTISSAED